MMSLFQFKKKLPKGLTVEDVAMLEARNAGAAAAMDVKCDELMSELANLPQYLCLYSALLHIPSGCLVSKVDAAIVLVYADSVTVMVSTSSGGQRVELRNEEQLNKYMALMRLEAAKLQSI